MAEMFGNTSTEFSWSAEKVYKQLPNEGTVDDLVNLLVKLAQRNNFTENQDHYVRLYNKGPHVGWQSDNRYNIGIAAGYQTTTHGLHVVPTGKASTELPADFHIKWENINS